MESAVKTLIIEVGTEEVPARFIEEYAEELKSKIRNIILNNRLSVSDDYKLYYTPRRVIFIEDIKFRQDDEEREIIGPPVRICFDEEGRPTKALGAFIEKNSISLEEVYRKEAPKGEVVAAKIKIFGQKAIDILKEALVSEISSIKFKKSMRWGKGNLLFVRPIRWIVAVLGLDVISFELSGVKSSNRSFGNFNVDREGFEVRDRDDLLRTLKKRYVIYDASERQDIIVSSVDKVFKEYRADRVIDEDLVKEVVNLLEYPVPIKGSFDGKYLELPVELLEVVQRHHQRYFPVKCKGKILPIFVAFANNPVGDTDVIRAGMERVLRARLNDAVFFFREDIKKGITQMAKQLKMVMYHKNLGDYDSKSQRLMRVSEYLALEMSLSDEMLQKVKKTAYLAKADLVSLSVGEFPELQGIMGKYFAISSGLCTDIALGIEEHYKPIKSGGDLPEGILGSLVAIADRIDHLCGLFLINQKPTASSDPYGVRRAAQAIIDIIQFNKFKDIRLSELIDFTLSGFNIDEIRGSDNKIQINTCAKDELLEFFRVRLKGSLSESLKPDVVEAILNAEDGIEDISSIFERKESLFRFIVDEEFEKFAVVYKRAYNITKDFNLLSVDQSLFESEEEKALFRSYMDIRQYFNDYLIKRDYLSAMNLLKENLYRPVFDFFDKVFVMVDDERVRSNRLALLKNIVIMFRKIIDLSYISSIRI